jgi:uncharacterized protein (TIGR00369 family)
MAGARRFWFRLRVTCKQHGLIHAGVLTTMADHTSGCAARSVVGLEHDVITVEFKINFLRPAVPDRVSTGGSRPKI